MAVITSPGQIPANTKLADKNGLPTNAWYFFWKNQAQYLASVISNGPYVSAGGGATSAYTIIEGLDANKGTGVEGDIYFAYDTGTIYVNVVGSYQPMIPAYSGDVTSSVGSKVLTLNNVNPVTYGTFYNATVTVNEKGLVTFASTGPNANVTSVGAPGTIQLAAAAGLFDGDQLNFSYVNTSVPTLNLGNSSLLFGPVIALQSDVAADNLGMPVYSVIQASSGLILDGIVGMQLQTNRTTWVALDGNGTLLLQGDPGTPGEVLTSNGPGTPATWQSAGAVLSTSGFSGDLNCGLLTGAVIARINCGDLSSYATFSMNMGSVVDNLGTL